MINLNLDNLEEFKSKYGSIAMQVKGDCMEAVGIFEGDIIAVDLTIKPIPRKSRNGKDIVLIWDLENNNPAVKEYVGAWGGTQWVSTRYANIGEQPNGIFRMNQSYIASHILGVVYACYSPVMELKWERDVSDCPAELSYKQMIKGNNIGEPVCAQTPHIRLRRSNSECKSKAFIH